MGRYRLNIDDYEEESDEDDNESHKGALVSYSQGAQPMLSPQLHDSVSEVVTPSLGFAHHNYTSDHVLDPYYNLDSPPKRGISFWWWIVFVAVLAHVVSRHGPPAPPRIHEEDKNWAEFFDIELARLWNSITSLLSTIPYVGRYCWQSLQDDVAELLRAPPCSPHLPESVGWKYIIGQPAARTALSNAFDAWDQSGPLLLLHSGTIGIGKMEMAKQFANIVFQHCNTDPLEESLMIRGDEYAKRSDLSIIIQQYANKRPMGGVIILHHIEKLSPITLSSCMQLIRQFKSRIMVFATTYVGSKAIHRSLKQSESVSSLELDLSLRHEIDAELGAEITQYFHAVAPFVPLGRRELKLILFAKVQVWSKQTRRQLQLSSKLADALTDSSLVEYLVVRNKGEDILVFSSLGAKALAEQTPLYNMLLAQINRCFGNEGMHEHIANMDYDEETEEGVFRWCTNDVTSDQDCEETCRFYLRE